MVLLTSSKDKKLKLKKGSENDDHKSEATTSAPDTTTNQPSYDPVININDFEKIKGKQHPVTKSFVYLGIPYAKPPIGERRFAPPVELENLGSEEFDATDFSYQCVDAHQSEIGFLINQF